MLKEEIYSGENDIDNDITEYFKSHNITPEFRNDDRISGKKDGFKLGTLCYLKRYYCLLAFTKFDKNDNAFLLNKEYILSLLNMWDNLYKTYNCKSIVIPLLGAGITRFPEANKGTKLSNQELLDGLLYSLKLSGKIFNSKITILIAHNDKELKKINLFDIGEKDYDI